VYEIRQKLSVLTDYPLGCSGKQRAKVDDTYENYKLITDTAWLTPVQAGFCKEKDTISPCCCYRISGFGT
jgi:hypothetical protein